MLSNKNMLYNHEKLKINQIHEVINILKKNLNTQKEFQKRIIDGLLRIDGDPFLHTLKPKFCFFIILLFVKFYFIIIFR